jgi:hypothetical protein
MITAKVSFFRVLTALTAGAFATALLVLASQVEHTKQRLKTRQAKGRRASNDSGDA